MNTRDKLFYFFALPLLTFVAIAALRAPDKPVAQPGTSSEHISWKRVDVLKDTVIRTAKNPDSIRFQDEYYSDDTSCVTYTGTNGYGATVRGVAFLHKGSFGTDTRTFNEVCK